MTTDGGRAELVRQVVALRRQGLPSKQVAALLRVRDMRDPVTGLWLTPRDVLRVWRQALRDGIAVTAQSDDR